MSQLIAISIAIGDELTRKRWWPPRNLDAKMGKNYHYDSDSLSAFLISVRHRLETSISEAYTFSFDAAFAKKGLGMPISELIGAIDERAHPVARPNMLAAAFASEEALAVEPAAGGRGRSSATKTGTKRAPTVKRTSRKLGGER